MTQTVFSLDLDQFCRPYATPVPGSAFTFGGPIQDGTPDFLQRFIPQQANLFQKLMLFDRVHLGFVGPNVLAPLLYNYVGDRAFHDLLHQDALSFVVWDQIPFPFPGKDGTVLEVAAGHFHPNTPLDLEKVIDQGFALQPTGLSTSAARKLKKLLLARHSVTQRSLGDEVLQIARTALRDGRLKAFGLDQADTIAGRSAEDGKRFVEAVDALLRYQYTMSHGMTTLFDTGVFDLFSTGVDRLRHTSHTFERFATLAEYERFPDLTTLFSEIDSPFTRAAKFRDTYRAREFRRWFAETGGSVSQVEQIREYVEALGNRRGLFEAVRPKLLKMVAMTAFGAFLSAKIGEHHVAEALNDMVGGLVAAKAAETLTDFGLDFGLDAIDSLFIDNIKIGWIPKSYFDGLRHMRKAAALPKSKGLG